MKRTALIAILLAAASISTAQASDVACVWGCLAMKAKAAIDADAALKPFDIQVKAVDTYDVKLSGSVDEGEQMAHAGELTEQIKGVRYVFNDLMPKN
ncbi:BON domain-containing protein [Chitinibacter bivalviorum]|uniref:BON domain-containing protein n=1 Tax=Chitinibacter bivalviorum TaxID=2739434 RepID=A0A7H9BMK5_9NEIS|nr:BON domain-containing protein [Chitinibacter bivalviorum]QLG89321.1 BON domain-containing protein [Chitinibacter bivalviorum]